MIDNVNHPKHYTWLTDICGIEVIDITRHMDFDLGNALKYILRAGHKSEEGYTNRQKEIEDLNQQIEEMKMEFERNKKLNDKDKTIEDLKKARWYIDDKIKMLEHDVD